MGLRSRRRQMTTMAKRRFKKATKKRDRIMGVPRIPERIKGKSYPDHIHPRHKRAV